MSRTLQEARNHVFNFLNGKPHDADFLELCHVKDSFKVIDAALALLPQGGPAPLDAKTVESVQRGLEDSKAGRVKYLGSFAKYAEEEEGEPSPEAGPHPLATLAQDQVDLPADFAKVLHENLWDLMTPGDPPKTEGRSAPGEPGETALRDFGYAPGDYMGRCCDCKQTMENVDKRALRCWDCATKAYYASAETAKPSLSEAKGPSSPPLPVPLSDPREWALVWREGAFKVRPGWDLKVGESAWPFKDGQYVLLREVLPGQEALETHWRTRYDKLEAKWEAAEARLREAQEELSRAHQIIGGQAKQMAAHGILSEYLQAAKLPGEASDPAQSHPNPIYRPPHTQFGQPAAPTPENHP